MFAAFYKALSQSFQPPLSLLVRNVALATLAAMIALWVALWLAIGQTSFFAIGWLDTVVAVLGELAAVVLTLVLFPGVAGLALSLFVEDIAAVIEARDYPRLGAAREQNVIETVWVALRFTAVTVAVNLAILPLYLIPVLNAFVFLGVNGYLLGREYFEMVVHRRLDARAAAALRRRMRWRVVGSGVLIAAFAVIPFVNLITPVVAAAFMVHLVAPALANGPDSPAAPN